MIPGARGCTPAVLRLSRPFTVLTAAGANRVFGLSTQDTAYQPEAVERLHLPFAALSDEAEPCQCACGCRPCRWQASRLLKRLAMVIDDGRITKVFYPVFPAGP